MIGLDTDHLSVLERSGQPGSGAWRARMTDLPSADVVTTIIRDEEQRRGWDGLSGTDAVCSASGGSLSAAVASGQRPLNPGVGV
jgi:hypothetical protein